MNLTTIQEVLRSPLHRALFGAALLLANEGGATVAELSRQLDISKMAIRAYTRIARHRRAWNPRAFLVYSRIIAGGCDHAQLRGPGFRICLYCLVCNRPDHPALLRSPGTDPSPEPTKVYRPGGMKGGIG